MLARSGIGWVRLLRSVPRAVVVDRAAYSASVRQVSRGESISTHVAADPDQGFQVIATKEING